MRKPVEMTREFDFRGWSSFQNRCGITAEGSEVGTNLHSCICAELPMADRRQLALSKGRANARIPRCRFDSGRVAALPSLRWHRSARHNPWKRSIWSSATGRPATACLRTGSEPSRAPATGLSGSAPMTGPCASMASVSRLSASGKACWLPLYSPCTKAPMARSGSAPLVAA